MNTPTAPNTTQGAQTANHDPVNSSTQEPTVQNPSGLSALNPADPAAFSSIHNSQFIIHNSAASSQRAPHPKSSLAVFTPEQLAQIAIWVQTEKYDKASDLIFEKFGHKISTGALWRFFRNKVAIVEHLEDTPETAAAAADILQLAANANHKFTEASLHVLEQTAFKLSLACAHKTSDLDLLNRINNIICRSRNTAVRERHATVQEKKADLRTRELDLKHQILQARLDGRLTPTPTLNRNLNPNLFSQAPRNSNEPITQHSTRGTENLDAPIQNPVHLVNPVQDNSTRPKIRILVDQDGEAFVLRPGPCPLPDDVIIKNRAYAKKLLAGLVDPDTGEELPDPVPPTAVPLNTDSLNTEPSSSLSKLETENSKLLEPPSAPSASNSNLPLTTNPLPLPSLAEQVDAYTVDRIREYICHNQNHTPWPYRHPAPEFITENRHCPCGHACPCPTHETIPDIGPFPPIFWKITPFHPDYALCLQYRNLPFRRPTEYLA